MNVANMIELDRPVAVPRAGVADIVKSYRRQLPLFLAVAALIFLLVAAFTWTRTPRYTALASIEVAPRKVEVGSDRSSPVNDPSADASVDTQVEVLGSPTLAAIVVDRLDLADEPMFGRLTRAPGLGSRLGLSAATAPVERLTARQRRAAAIDRLQQDLSVRRVAQTFVLEISVTTSERALAAQIANGFADAFVQQSRQIKMESAQTAGRLLDSQLSKAQAGVNAAEEALGRYKIANNLVNVAGGTVAEQELTNLDTEVASAQATEAEARARYSTAREQLQRGSNGEDVGEALNSPVVQELRKQRSEVARKVADYSSRYGPRFPALSSAQSELDSIDAQIHGEVRRILASLEAQSRIASQRAGSLAGSRNATRGAVASNNAASIRLGELQLKANAARLLYEQLLGRVRELSTEAATTQADARIAALATTPTRPSSPNIPINLLVGLLLGIAGGTGAAVLRQGLDQGLSTLEDIETRLGMPYLGSLPTLDSSVAKPHGGDPIAAILTHRGSAFAEAFRSLSAALLEGKHGVRTILFTSSIPNEGKTTAAICLARMIAMSGKRVVLVDADLRRPSVMAAMGLAATAGVHEVLHGGRTIEDATVHDAATGLDVLATLPSETIDMSSIEDGSFAALIEQLRMRYDVVVLDGSPVLPVVDGRLLAKIVDAVVFLVRWRKTPEAAVQMASHLLATVGAGATGIALSRVDLQSLARSGYGDPAKFFKLYDSYYHQ